MKYNKTKFLIFIGLLASSIAFSQNNCGYVAGYCCSNAPIICNLNCLEGFEGTLLDPSSQIIKDNLSCQPKVLCTTGGNGQNMSWFAFIAGSNYAKITISPFNCANNFGIQVGMFGDCDFSDDLDKTMFPIASEYIDCKDPLPANNIPLTLESSNLKPGQTYYFYVDGNKADICSYRVKVDKADQATDIPDLLQFDQGKDTLNLCPKSNYTLGVQSYPLEIKFFWKVKSPGNSHPFVNFTPLDTQVVDFKFDSLGTYEISMFAYNGCDATDTITKTIIVRPYENEKFLDVAVCENKFPYAGPQIEDPNKDGISGWQGPNILSAGLSKYTVYLAAGCQYDQEINVKTYTLQPAQDVVIVDCSSFNYHGFTVNSNVQDIPITIPASDRNGCDSLVSLDAYILDVKGNLQQQACINNGITIGFNSSLISSPPGYKLSYIWRDQNGSILIDNDNDPTNIETSSKSTLSLEVILEVLGKKCSFNVGSINVDPATQIPSSPLTQNWDVELCEGNTVIDYQVSNVSGVTYTWSVTNGGNVLSSSIGNKVTIDFSSLTSGSTAQLCIVPKNACGVGPETCIPITVYKKPVVDIANDKIDVCTDSILTFNHGNTPTYEYNWTLGQATILSGNANTAGPLKVQYPLTGQYQVQLSIKNKECSSDLKIIDVNVIQKVSASAISFTPYANKIDVTWTAVPCAKSYSLFINDQFQISTSALQYELTNLETNEILKATIKVEGDGNCACGTAMSDAQINTLNCNEHQLAIDKKIPTLICEDDWVNNIQLSASYTNTANNNLAWSGLGVNASGQFSPMKIGAGNFWIKVDVLDKGCFYQDSILFTLLKKPEVGLKSWDPECAEDKLGAIEILKKDPQQLLNYFVDGDKVNGPMVDNIAIGNHQLEVIDANNCKLLKSITINPPIYPIVEVNGSDKPIYDNESVKLTLDPKNSELILIDSIEWYVNGKLLCKGDCRSINFPSMEGGEYTHQIFIYYKNCIMEKNLDFVVKESPKLFFSNIINTSSSIESNKYFSVFSNDAELKISEINIYSRWGELVFTKKNFNPTNENQLWDGTFNGKVLLPGVYVLQVSYIDEKGILISINKDITLIK